VITAEGLEENEADGAFDPHLHEALLATLEEGVESGDIVEVVQRGYRLGDVVLRPVLVIVAE
jgi:molecular chaperone GrpE